MNYWDIIIGILIAAAAGCAIWSIVRSRRGGSSSSSPCCGRGCSGDCSKCRK